MKVDGFEFFQNKVESSESFLKREKAEFFSPLKDCTPLWSEKYSFYAIARSWDEALSICLRFALPQSEKKVLECTEDGKY